MTQQQTQSGDRVCTTAVQSSNASVAPEIRGRVVRLLATSAVLVTVIIGSLWGQDGAFPFGPFRMFSTRDDPNSSVVVNEIVGITATGQQLTITGEDIGLRRAEIEGQLTDLQQHPEGLARIAAAYQRRHNDAKLARIQLVQQKYQLHDGQAATQPITSVLADWERR